MESKKSDKTQDIKTKKEQDIKQKNIKKETTKKSAITTKKQIEKVASMEKKNTKNSSLPKSNKASSSVLNSAEKQPAKNTLKKEVKVTKIVDDNNKTTKNSAKKAVNNNKDSKTNNSLIKNKVVKIGDKEAKNSKQNLKKEEPSLNKVSGSNLQLEIKKERPVLVTEQPKIEEKKYNENIANEIKNLDSQNKVLQIEKQNNKTNNINDTINNNKLVEENIEKLNIKNVNENSKTKVLFVVSECHPFCATGGLADVAEGLPKFINNNSNIDMRVVLPMYSDIPEEYRSNFKFLGYKYIPVAWRNVYCGLFTYELNGVTYYFLDNEYYFKRGGGIYSYYDDGERFAFSSRAVLELLDLMNFMPNIIHCNDWQSALIPIYLKTNYANNFEYSKIKTVFTLHNTEYQGKFDLKIISDLFGIDAKYTSLLEYNKDLNLVKGAICCCDRFTTVSPTYAQEILTPEHSNGLDAILRQNAYKIRGILNAIDCEFYNPKTDKVLYKNYDIKTVFQKVENKTAVQKELGLEQNKDIPMLSIVTRMAKHKGLDLIKACLENIVANNSVQFIAVGGGDKEYEDYFKYLQNKYPTKVKALLGYSNIWGRKAYGASDIFLMPSKSEPCGISQMIASRYGAIPIVRETGGLKDSMWDFGCPNGGNAYTFHNYNTGDLVYSINRALKDYENKEDWKNKVNICMNRDFSWKVSANDYVNMYNELLK